QSRLRAMQERFAFGRQQQIELAAFDGETQPLRAIGFSGQGAAQQEHVQAALGRTSPIGRTPADRVIVDKSLPRDIRKSAVKKIQLSWSKFRFALSKLAQQRGTEPRGLKA